MKIEDLDEAENGSEKSVFNDDDGSCRGFNKERRMVVRVDAKRALVGAGARILFYPTLLYNVFRNKINQAEFRWWDEIDQVLFLSHRFSLNFIFLSGYYLGKLVTFLIWMLGWPISFCGLIFIFFFFLC